MQLQQNLNQNLYKEKSEKSVKLSSNQQLFNSLKYKIQLNKPQKYLTQSQYQLLIKLIYFNLIKSTFLNLFKDQLQLFKI